MTWAIPAIVLIVLSEVVWDPTRGIVVQGALIGRSPRCSPWAWPSSTEPTGSSTSPRATSGVVPALFAILLVAKDRPGGAPDWMTGIPYPVAIVVGLATAIFLGFLVERTFINRFSQVAPTGPDRRHHRHRAAADRPRALHARVVRVQDVGRPELNPPFDIKVEIGGVFFDDNDLMVFLIVPLRARRPWRCSSGTRGSASRSERSPSAPTAPPPSGSRWDGSRPSSG